MDTVPTVTVNRNGTNVVINESDFDPKRDRLASSAAAVPAGGAPVPAPNAPAPAPAAPAATPAARAARLNEDGKWYLHAADGKAAHPNGFATEKELLDTLAANNIDPVTGAALIV